MVIFGKFRQSRRHNRYIGNVGQAGESPFLPDIVFQTYVGHLKGLASPKLLHLAGKGEGVIMGQVSVTIYLACKAPQMKAVLTFWVIRFRKS